MSEFVKPRSLIRQEIDSRVGSVRLDRVVYEMDGGRTTKAVVLTASAKPEDELMVGLHLDRRFLHLPIETGNALLIDQKRTEEEWGSPAGRKPESFISGKYPAIGFPFNHFGWMRENILVEDGIPELVANDKKNLTIPQLTVIGWQNERWQTRTVGFEEGQITHPDQLDNMKIGFSVPLMVQEGNVVPLEQTITDPRYRGDLRNIFDFSGGGTLSTSAWLDLRPLLPETADDARNLLAGEEVITETDKLSQEQVDNLQGEFDNEGSRVRGVLRAERSRHTGVSKLFISGRLPHNRIPSIVGGYTGEGDFKAVIIDGRQKHSVGATILEASDIAQGEEMKNGGLGPAGGDVALFDHTKEIINKPATEGNITRPYPVVLYFTKFAA